MHLIFHNRHKLSPLFIEEKIEVSNVVSNWPTSWYLLCCVLSGDLLHGGGDASPSAICSLLSHYLVSFESPCKILETSQLVLKNSTE